MKTFVQFLAVACSLCLFASCANSPNVTPKQVFKGTIDFQANFKKSHVTVYIDGEETFDGILTTIAVLSYAGKHISFETEKPKIHLEIIINDIIGYHDVDLRKGSHLGISYHWIEKRTWLIQSKNPFEYD